MRDPDLDYLNEALLFWMRNKGRRVSSAEVKITQLMIAIKLGQLTEDDFFRLAGLMNTGRLK